MVQWWHLTFSLLRFPFYYCTCTDSRGTNMLLWERKCPFYVERKYNSLHKLLILQTYITDCKQIQWFPINFVGPSNGNYYEESNGTKIMKCTQVLDGEKDQKPLFRYEKVGAQRSKMPHRHLENWPFAAGCTPRAHIHFSNHPGWRQCSAWFWCTAWTAWTRARCSD